MIEGAVKYHSERLITPEIIKKDVEAYRIESNTLSLFIDECCEVGVSLQVSKKHLFNAYRSYCADNNERWSMTSKEFTQQLKKMGYVSRHSREGDIWQGITLKGQGITVDEFFFKKG